MKKVSLLSVKYFTITLILLSFTSYGLSELQSNNEWKAPEAANNLKNPLPFSDKNLSSGKKIFDNLCWSCHGLDGKGNGPVAATLMVKPADFSSTQVQHQSDGAIYWKISTGKGNMASYGELLTTTQRWQLVRYLRIFKGTSENETAKEKQAGN